jgi:SAM-dependent methyltransferase
MPVLAALDRRDRVPELMDWPGLDPAEHRTALAALARINRLSLSAEALWPPIARLARTAGRPLRVLDIATGSGDVPVRLWAKARRAGLAVEFAGCDVSPTAVAEAARHADSAVRLFTHDAIRDPLPDGFDVVTCSLFLHHLSDDDAVTALRRMKGAGRLVLVNDLARSRFNYLAVWLACHLTTRSRVVRFDGPASVRSAFTPAEALALAGRAGLTGARVSRRFPCRFLLSWSRT